VETVIVSVICIALMVFGGMTMSQGFLTSVDSTTFGLSEMGQRDEDIIRTDLDMNSTAMQSATTLEIYLDNNGQTKLADFQNWDVIIQYYDSSGNYYVEWLPYTEAALGDNQWEKSGIYYNGEAEIYEQGILNPGERLKITAKLNPAVGPDTANMVVITTSNGVSASVPFINGS